MRSGAIFTLFLIILFSICYNLLADLECFMIEPPEKVLENVKKIAVLDFEGKDGKGKQFADYLISELLDEDRGIRDIKGFLKNKEGKTYLEGARTNVFQLVERSQLESVLSEQGLGMTGIVEDNQAAEVGRVLGLDALVLGNVSYSYVDKDEKRKYTVNKKTYYKYCTTRTTKAEVRLKIISVSTGEILGTKDLSQSYHDDKCDEERSGLLSPSVLANYCLMDIAYWMANYFTPKFSLVEYDFEKIKYKEFKKQAKEASKLASKGMIDEAFPIYNSIYEADPYNPKAAYNLAHLYQAVGHFDRSLELYKEAYEMEPDNKDFQESYDKAKSLSEFNIVLKNLGVEISEHKFASNVDALADKITTKGSRSDRIDIYTKPDINSAVIAQVPGDLEFVVISQEGDWYFIKLKGDDKGYIQESDID